MAHYVRTGSALEVVPLKAITVATSMYRQLVELPDNEAAHLALFDGVREALLITEFETDRHRPVTGEQEVAIGHPHLDGVGHRGGTTTAITSRVEMIGRDHLSHQELTGPDRDHP